MLQLVNLQVQAYQAVVHLVKQTVNTNTTHTRNQSAIIINMAFRILQFNCNGLNKKLDEIINYMVSNEILIATIQGTSISKNSNLISRNNYSILRTMEVD